MPRAHPISIFVFVDCQLFVGIFAEFNESTHCRFGVEEGDVEAFGAFAGSLVDKAAAFSLYFGERVGHAVFHGEGDVLNAAAAAVGRNELGDCAVVRCTFEQFELCLAYKGVPRRTTADR